MSICPIGYSHLILVSIVFIGGPLFNISKQMKRNAILDILFFVHCYRKIYIFEKYVRNNNSFVSCNMFKIFSEEFIYIIRFEFQKASRKSKL